MRSTRFPKTRFAAATFALAMLSACGGGADSTPASTTPPVQEAEPAQKPRAPQSPPEQVTPESPEAPETTDPAPPKSTPPTQDPDSPGLPSAGDPEKGTMGPLADWPLVPLHAALTPDGRLMTFGRDNANASEMVYDIWDWRAGLDEASHLTLPNRSGTDLFCSNQLLLSNGELLITGGDVRTNQSANAIGWQTNRGNSDVNIFLTEDSTLTTRGQMHEARWYATVTMLPWGEVYVQGGAIDVDADQPANYSEVANSDATSFRLLTGAPVSDLPWYYPRNFASRYGDVVGWSHNKVYRIDPLGQGARTNLGEVPQVELNNGSLAVMYRPSRILLGGGGTTRMISADISGALPSYDSVPPMSSQRLWGTATVLADGRVLASNGGTSDTSILSAPLGAPAYHTEIYDPETNQWTLGAASAVPRLYHSTAILLPDASVLIGGGGLPGPVTNLNAEIFYPPYLFGADGSPATRPQITSAPTVLNPGDSFDVNTSESAEIARISLIKTGAVTHSFDMDQRYVELSFTPTATGLRVSLPSIVSDTPPGFYHLFILNSQGVPSVSRIIRMNPFEGALPELPAIGEKTLMVGGTEGADRELACRAGEVLAGVHGRAYAHLVQAGPVCVNINTSGQWIGLPTERAVAGDPFGNTSPGAPGMFNLTCPADHAVSGFGGSGTADGQRVGALQLSCRSLISDNRVAGSPTLSPLVGSGSANTSAACSADGAAIGITGKTSINGYFGFGLRCGA
ncbi:MAG: galactose oxidase-like domain-containing protein [Burkholderiaceae bacterium]